MLPYLLCNNLFSHYTELMIWGIVSKCVEKLTVLHIWKSLQLSTVGIGRRSMQKSRKAYIDLLLLWVINLVDIFIWACIKMPGEHAVDFSCSLILIICCPHCVRSYLKITYKSITALLILKLPDASCILKVHLYFYC